MAKKEVVWTKTAQKQRRAILEYWKERNKSSTYSETLVRLISRKIDIITSFPEVGKNTDFVKTRVVVFGHFSIFYQIGNDKIIITAIWDNRQDPKNLLKIVKHSSG